MRLNTVFIDDEPLALKLMEEFAAKIPFLHHCCSFSKSGEAMAYLRENKADLVFLDINMPDLSGLDIAKEIAPNTFTVLCTAYPEFALQGYELNVADYLVKPFAFDRFLKAACRAQELFLQKRAYNIEQNVQIPASKAFIFVKSEYNLVKITLDDILIMEGLKDYVKIHMVGIPKPILTLQSLRALEEKLPPAQFCRVHKSYIININHLQLVQKNNIQVAGREIPMGNQFRDRFLELVNSRTPR